MSYRYRDRVNRDKPRLSDRFRGKSGEEIVEELRKDFAKRKQMFFDTAPRTPDFSKPGFPFDDTSRWRNRGDSDLKHRLDEIAQRYPEFADQLRDWTTEESPSGMGWGSKQAQSQPTTPQQSAGQAPQTEAAATTTQQQQPQQQTPTQPVGPEGDARTQRAMSAPPDNRPKEQPQRFVSRLEINPNSSSGEAAQQPAQPVQQPQPQASQPQPQASQPPPQQSAQPEPKKKPSNVRHIPIFVEGRNETVMPKADVDTTADFGRSFGSPPREMDSRDLDDGFHGPAYAKYAPPGFGFSNKPWHSSFNQRSSPFMTRDPMPSPPQQRKHFPQQQHHPQYQPHQSHQHPPQPSHPHPQQQHHPHPQQQHHPQPPQPQQPHPHPQQPHPQQPHPEPARPQTPPKQPPPPSKPKDPLEVVADVQKDVDELLKQVEAFNGAHRDKQYVYLDEMLTRNLIKLDLVETEGKENVRAARKETIKCIQKAISLLESKTMTPEEIAARDKAMEVDPEPSEVESMEVSTEGEPAATQTPGPTDESTPSPAPAPLATPVPDGPSEPTPTAAPAPAAPAPPSDTPLPDAPAPPTETTESKDSQTSSMANPEATAQPEATAAPPVNNPPAETAAPAAAS